MTNKRVRLDRAALEELRAAAVWYEGQSVGLGDRFLDATQQALDFAARFPTAAPSARGVPKRLRARTLGVTGFPYAVIYRDDDQEIRVFAFAHSARAPGYWRERF